MSIEVTTVQLVDQETTTVQYIQTEVTAVAISGDTSIVEAASAYIYVPEALSSVSAPLVYDPVPRTLAISLGATTPLQYAVVGGVGTTSINDAAFRTYLESQVELAVSLSELQDVNTTGVTTDDFLRYNGTIWAPVKIRYTHNQTSPASTWTVTHNLHTRPNIQVVDSGDNVQYGDVSYVSDDVITIVFSSPFSGKAYLS